MLSSSFHNDESNRSFPLIFPPLEGGLLWFGTEGVKVLEALFVVASSVVEILDSSVSYWELISEYKPFSERKSYSEDQSIQVVVVMYIFSTYRNATVGTDTCTSDDDNLLRCC